MNLLTKYLHQFEKLNIDRSHGGIAPHKPVLLLSILQGFSSGLIRDNKIFITPELVAIFKSNWSALVVTNHHCQFVYPFFYMKSGKLWTLKPKPGYETFLKNTASIKSFNKLNDAVEYALIDEGLMFLMKDQTNNAVLRAFLLDHYFPGTKGNLKFYDEQNVMIDFENKILNEDPALYQNEIRKLIQEKEEEEIYLRGGAFKREIPKIYNNTCCISGLKIDATVNISMIDACHIVPFSESYNDTITNGIALCPNLHRAFDRGILSIDDEYRVVVSDTFVENESDYSIRKYNGKKILLPLSERFYPSQENLEWHRRNVYW